MAASAEDDVMSDEAEMTSGGYAMPEDTHIDLADDHLRKLPSRLEFDENCNE